MRLRTTPPAIPKEFLDRYGEPEDAFGPNRRFRIASILLGSLLCLLGLAFLTFGVLGKVAPAQRGGSEGILMLLGGGLLTIGAASVLFPMSVPLNWVFVCPGGLIRARGEEWDAVGWSDVAGFQVANVSSGSASIRQCSILTVDGAEWGFQANWLANYGMLVALLRRKLEGRVAPANPL